MTSRLRSVWAPRIGYVFVLALALSACAKKEPPVTTPGAPKFPEFVFPAVSPAPSEAMLTRHEQASLKSFKRTRAGAILSSPLRIAGSNAAKQILSAQYAAVPSRCPQPDRA